MRHNQEVDDTPSNPLEALIHHTDGEAVMVDCNLVGDTNALRDQKLEEVNVAHHCQYL